MSVGKYRWVTNRKPQLCFGCNHVQPMGCRVLYWTSLYDGAWNSGYCCEPCHEVYQGLDSWAQEECGLWDLSDSWDDLPTPPCRWLPSLEARA